MIRKSGLRNLSRRHLLRGAGAALSQPLLVAGGHQLGFNRGQHVAFDANHHPPLSNVLVTVAKKAGLPLKKFQDSTGTLTAIAQ